MNERDARPAILIPVVVALVLLLTTVARFTPPDPTGEEAADEFSAVRARGVLDGILGDESPHPIGTEANRAVRDRVLNHFRSLGLDPEIDHRFVCGANGACSWVDNILVRIDGSDSTGALLLAVHYDSVPAGPGASDDGVAVAIALEVARIVSESAPLRNDVIVLVDDGEEGGLLGAEAFLQHRWAKDVSAVVNLEARGSSGQSFMFETSPGNSWLIDHAARSLRRPAATSVFYTIYKRLPNDTDLTVFKRGGLEGVNFAFIRGVAHYHTPLDDVDHASLATIQHQGENALAMVRSLAGADLKASHSSFDSVYFDLFGWWLVRWPERWSPVFSIAALLLLTFAMTLEMKRRAMTWRDLGFSILWWPVGAGGAGVAAAALTWINGRLHLMPTDWPATGIPIVVAFWLIGVAVPLFALRPFADRLARIAIQLTSTLWVVALAIAGSFVVPGIAYLVLVPAVVASAMAMVAAVASDQRLRHLGVVLATFSGGVVILPLAWGLWDAMGIPIMPVATVLIAIMTMLVIPLAPRPGLAIPVGLIAASAVLLAVSFLMPPFSEESPKRLNLLFLQDTDSSSAHFLTSETLWDLPPSMRDAAPWEDDMIEPFPWYARSPRYLTATAPRLEVDPPLLETLADETTNGGRRIELRLTSRRGAERATMILHDISRVLDVRVNQVDFDLRTPRFDRYFAPNNRRILLLTVPDEGILIDLTVTGSSPIDVTLFDESFGLPSSAASLSGSRPATAVPSGTGDTTIVLTRVKI